MTDQAADQPDSPPSSPDPQGAVRNAAGVSGIVAIGQTLDDPWRGIVSVAGPWLVVVWRWLVPTLRPAVELWGLSLLNKAVDRLDATEAEKRQLKDRIQRARVVVFDKVTRWIGRDK